MEQLRWWLELREREFENEVGDVGGHIESSKWNRETTSAIHVESRNIKSTSITRHQTRLQIIANWLRFPFPAKIFPRSANSLRRAFSIIKLMISFDLYCNKDIFGQVKGWDRASHINHDLSIICDFQWFSTIPYTQLNSKTMKIPFNDIFH